MWMEKLKLEPLCLIKRDAQQHPLLMWLLASIRRNSFCFSSISTPPSLHYCLSESSWSSCMSDFRLHDWARTQASPSTFFLPSFLFSSPLLTFFPVSVSFIVLTFVFNTSSIFPLLLPCHPLPSPTHTKPSGLAAVCLQSSSMACRMLNMMCAWISLFPSLIRNKKKVWWTQQKFEIRARVCESFSKYHCEPAQ